MNIFHSSRQLEVTRAHWHLLWCLHFEGTACSSSSSTLKLPTLGTNIRLRLAMWHTRSFSKMSARLSSIATTLYEQGVLSRWSFQSELVEGEHFSACFEDAHTSVLSEPECTYGQLGNVEKTNIIGDRTNHNTDLVTFRAFHSADNPC